MKQSDANILGNHHDECGSHEYYRTTLYINNEMRVIYKCKQCNNTIKSVNNKSDN